MEQLGTIARLQVQVAPLKRGQRPHRWYDADRIRPVGSLTITEQGVLGHRAGGEPIVDVHHRDHPESRHRGTNGISLCPTGHYTLLRARFGPHLRDGTAGENLLLAHADRLHLEDLIDGVTIVGQPGPDGQDRQVVLAPVEVAEPCVEFSRFALDRTDTAASVREPLRALGDGMRGFYLGVRAGAGARIHLGDRVIRGVPT